MMKSSDKKKEVFLYNDHPRPKSRREFLSSGLIGMTAFALGPSFDSILRLSPQEVMAQECAHPKMCTHVPYLCFEAAGGMNLPGGNVMVGFGAGEDQMDFGSTQSLSDYIKMGLPPTMHPSLSGMVNNTFGLKFHSTSGLMAGLNSVLSPKMAGESDLRNSIDGAFICAISADDSNSNPINTSHMARKAGASGDLVQIVGTQNTSTGARSTAPQSEINLLYRPSTLRSFKDGEGLISIGDRMMGEDFLDASDPNMGVDRIKAFMAKVRRIGISRFREVASLQEEIRAKEKMETVFQGTQGVFNQFSPVELNPSKNADINTLRPIFGDLQQDGSYNISRKSEEVATIANLVLKRIAGVGNFTMGGYDYHNGSAASGNLKDYELGKYIGMCIKLAAAKGENLFIHLYTDGGVTADAGGAMDVSADGKGRVNWVSDSGTRSGTLMLVYKHGHSRVDYGESSSLFLSGRKRQIGYFKQGGGVQATANSMSNNINQLWMGVILNYLATMVNSTDDDEIINIVGSVFKERFGDPPPDWKNLIRFRSLIA